MAERDFVEKLQRAGFEHVRVIHRTAWGIDDCALYPLFGDDLIALMRRLIPPERQNYVGESIVIKARLGTKGEIGSGEPDPPTEGRSAHRF